jgi:hypothetical protein
MPNIHEFNSTGQAYDASQCCEDIKDGDILVVRNEKVVGILTEAWPVAITQNSGAFHTHTETCFWHSVPQVKGGTKDYSESFLMALTIADDIGAEIS